MESQYKSISRVIRKSAGGERCKSEAGSREIGRTFRGLDERFRSASNTMAEIIVQNECREWLRKIVRSGRVSCLETRLSPSELGSECPDY